LNKKNADIYIQRCRNLRAKAKRRTRLMELSLTSMKFVILADSAMSEVSALKRFILVSASQLGRWPVSS
jgi:hypothetical protein